MLRIIDISSNSSGQAQSGLSPVSVTEASALAAEAWRTGPQLTGALRVDLEIVLPSPGMDVRIAWFYNSNATFTSGTMCGMGRTVSTNLVALADGSPLLVTLTRGDGSLATYLHDGSGNYGPTNFSSGTQGNINNFAKDGTGTLWLEATPNGQVTAYPVGSSGVRTSVSYVQDAVGNRHTFSYSSGLLQTLQDAVGRKVTFSYSSGRLSTIKDWAGRVTTFAYDISIGARPVLSSVTGPTGCVTEYAYDSGTRLTQITDPNGYATSYAYDGANRVTQRTIATMGTTGYAQEDHI